MYRLWRRFSLFFYLTGGCLVSHYPMLSRLSNFYFIMHRSITNLILCGARSLCPWIVTDPNPFDACRRSSWLAQHFITPMIGTTRGAVGVLQGEARRS